MHVLNRLISRKPAGLIGSFREETYRRYGKLFCYTALVSIVVALVLSFNNAAFPFYFFIYYFACRCTL